MQMVDLKSQYQKLKPEIDAAVIEVLDTQQYINGAAVKRFQAHLESYLDDAKVVPCANGTDALQIAMMALGLKPGDEVLVPAFTYVATAEVIALLQLVPVMVDVDIDDFTIQIEGLEAYVTPRTKAIVPVHLFGQCANMEAILKFGKDHNLFVIEDNAQAIGAKYTFSDGRVEHAGLIGDIGSTSFYPSKNLGAYGDAGALMTRNEDLAATCWKVANHGQGKRYYHDIVGVNSRLDSIQAAILDVKLKYLDSFCEARQMAADWYDAALLGINGVILPKRATYSTHVFHQYTMRIEGGRRDALGAYLQENGIPHMIYYPVPLYNQGAFEQYWDGKKLPVTEQLCAEVLSVPMHTELTVYDVDKVASAIRQFMNS
ncbi:MAG: DegT/DnrJ/EryC1/StrS family aminotransferase [Saprospiraceae bacterium]